jgi:hypothetical protein
MSLLTFPSPIQHIGSRLENEDHESTLTERND